MKVSVLTVAFATMAEAAFHERRQFGNPDVSDCGLDAFQGHTSEALLFCSNILKSGTATATITSAYTTTTTTTTKTTVTVQPSATPKPTPTPTPTPKPSSTPTPTPSVPSSSSTFISSSSSLAPSSSSISLSSSLAPSSSTLVSLTLASSPIISSSSPAPTTTPSCGVAGYVKVTPAYYFESSGTKNTFAACSQLCKADSKCKSFGFGEANCMLFDVTVSENTNLNPTSPYTFYDASCPTALKRSPQLNISLGLPIGGGGGGINISLGLGPSGISSACSCLITRGPASTTVTRTVSSGVTSTTTVVSTVTTTKGGARK